MFLTAVSLSGSSPHSYLSDKQQKQPTRSATREKHPNTSNELLSKYYYIQFCKKVKKNSLSTEKDKAKQKQLDVINNANPAPNTYLTWVRSVDDIKTLAETLEDSDFVNNEKLKESGFAIKGVSVNIRDKGKISISISIL